MANLSNTTHHLGNHGSGLKEVKMRKILNGIILPIVIFAYSSLGIASEDDKNAGTCAGYLAVLQKSSASIDMALGLADKPQRALNIGKEWIRKSQQAGASMGVAVEGDRACRSIGIRAVDMR